MPLVLVPGMEGDGRSCLYLAVPIWKRLDKRLNRRLVLVDFATEAHPTFDALVDTVGELLASVLDTPAAL